MTALKVNITLDNSCDLTVTDTSGFYNSGSNPTGFLPEANSDAAAFGIYKLSEGYFLNVLLYNKYNSAPVITNTSEGFYKVPNVVDATYANNFVPMIYNLSNDGTYTLKRYFIISLEYYQTQIDSGIFTGKTVYYTDGTSIFSIVNGVATPITITSFINASMTNATAVEVDSSFISTCRINNCYYKLLNIIIDSNIDKCYSKDYPKLVETKDILYMTLELIKYLQEDNNITQIQKIIEVVNGCCSICSGKLITNYSSKGGCGCG